jgi:dTDP-4-dehydrorhamnose reductase/dTDP-4-dehydrorhamnose 3,5-epimerase
MKVVPTELKDVLIVEPDVFGDHRGWFSETYSKEKYAKAGINVEFVQDNQSYSAKRGTLRGLHFQRNPMAQSKLVRCIRGKLLDVAVDLRKGSPTYKKWVGVELSAENKKQLFIPKGFAHGYLTLTDDVEMQYKVDEFYDAQTDGGIKFNDPEIGVNWEIEKPILSEKDQNLPFLKETNLDFKY